MLLQKIFGYSPTSNEVMMSFIGILIGLVINLYYKFGRVDEFMSVSKRTFLKIGVDTQDMRNDVTELKMDVIGVKKDMNLLKKDLNKEFSDIKKEISIIRKAVT